jgi:transcriptional regulator with XRE-family HTH domain
MSETVYRPEELVELRNKIGLTQARMAEFMGMPFRTYQALEGGQNPVKRPHVLAARYAAMLWALDEEEGDVMKLPNDIRAEINNLALAIEEKTGKKL